MKVLTSKEIPILFSTPMVQALLAGRKTQTRRIVKPAPQGRMYKEHEKETWSDTDWGHTYKCTYGKPGDIIYVRETWFPAAINGNKVLIGYNVEDPQQTIEITTDKVDSYWKQLDKGRHIPSIHMPKEAARIWLEVTEVRVERLQDISEEDAKAEGIERNCTYDGNHSICSTCTNQCRSEGEWLHYMRDLDDFPAYSAKESFQSLWQSINGPDSWNANPWVWVVSFKVLSTTGKPTP